MKLNHDCFIFSVAPTNAQLESVKKAVDQANEEQQQNRSKSPRNTLRLIPVDLSLLQVSLVF